MRTSAEWDALRQKIQWHWTDRLYQEYDHICFQHRVKLERPLLQIDILASQWGRWDPMTRSITLAAELIEKHPWDRVVEVLKHEMAHQMVWELWQCDEGHGPRFHEACRLLGMAAWAQRGEVELGKEPLVTESTVAEEEPAQRMLRRVEKLLALATSPNEHEAYLAMEKVRELYTKHNLARLLAAKKDSHIYLTIPLKRKRVEIHQTMICSLLNDFFFVRVIHSSLYDAVDLCDYKTVELLGTGENVLMAEYVFYFLSRKLGSLWDDFREQGSKPRSRRGKSSFFVGVLTGFRERLQAAEKAKKGSPGEKNQLVPLDRALETYVGYRFPRLVTVRGGRRHSIPESYEAGRLEGSRLVVNRNIAEPRRQSGEIIESWQNILASTLKRLGWRKIAI